MFDMSPRLRFFSLSCFWFSGVMIKFSFWFFVMYGLGMSLVSIIFNFPWFFVIYGLVCMSVWVYISLISNLLYRYAVVRLYSLLFYF